ncbi:MAG: hypothetical protein Q4G46_15770 [Propionibacteriaceae bacterium]|nr:hypothetical protein [Propionibacteriaceae bacterium]
MSPFLRKVKTASGATAVQIVEKKRGVRTIVEHLGSAHDDAELAVLLQVGREKLAVNQPALDLPVAGARAAATLRLFPQWSSDLGPDRLEQGKMGLAIQSGTLCVRRRLRGTYQPLNQPESAMTVYTRNRTLPVWRDSNRVPSCVCPDGSTVPK